MLSPELFATVMPEGKSGAESKFEEAPTAESKAGESKFADGSSGSGSSSSGEIMKRAKAYCFSNQFIDVFKDFIEKHAELFFDAVDNEEHKLEYTTLFEEYLEVFAKTMEDWLKQESITMAEFYNHCGAAQDEGRFSSSTKVVLVFSDLLPYYLPSISGDASDKHFIKLLLASAEYQCFYDVM